MLRNVKDLLGFSIGAADGIIGTVKDIYFDDSAWVIRYVVVETGAWLSSRRVLISPIAVSASPWQTRVLSVSLTKNQVKNSPSIGTDEPVSRQHELEYLRYYGYSFYWGGGGLWGRGAHPGSLISGLELEGAEVAYRRTQMEDARADAEADAEHRKHGDHHLRSCNTVMAYRIHASDGDIGHVKGFLLDEKTWAIRYMIVNTSDWWRGHDVLISPQWIEDVRWDDNKVLVSLTRDQVKNAPPYSADLPIHRGQEMGLYEHYGRAGYWASEVELQNPEMEFIPPVESTTPPTEPG
jgi:hypothetical protein